MKKLSVIIPCYNQSNYLKDAVLSVVNSTYKNIEIIVINDGSTDITAEEIQALLSGFDNVTLINQKNAGVCTARNNGIAAATGEYILPLDADDTIASTYIEKAVSILDNNPDIGIVYCEAEFWGRGKKWNLKPATLHNMLVKNRIFVSAVFRKSDFLKTGGYKTQMETGCEDWELWLSIMETGAQIYKIPEVLFYYRDFQNVRTKQALITRNYLQTRLNIIKLHKKLYMRHCIMIPVLFLQVCRNYLANLYKVLKVNIRIVKQYFKALKYLQQPQYGITTQSRKPKIIVSLTTFPERINEVHLTINTLLHQSLKPDAIILWLAEEEFKNKDLPESLVKLKKYGLEIKYYPKDIKSYKKIIPSILEYPDDILVLADDDLYYRRDWLELLYKSYLKEPESVHCHRGHRICFDRENRILPYSMWEKCVNKQYEGEIYLPTSGGGILLPHAGRNLFYKDITNEDLFLKLAPKTDDLWIWAMTILNNTSIRIVEDNITELIYVNPRREYGLSAGTTLYQTNSCGGNDSSLAAILEFYPQIKNIITDKRDKKCQKSV